MPWCYALASIIGTSHSRAGTRIQDASSAFLIKDASAEPHILVSIIADGAGSADFGGEGASIVCRTVSTLARAALQASADLPDEETIWSWIDCARDRIQVAASNRSRVTRDFASTMVLLIASREVVVTAHIGDGAIVARESATKQWVLLSAPDHGEYASTTYFLTDDPQPRLRYIRHANSFDALAAFSDGIEGLVLESSSGCPSPGFFSPMVQPLDGSATHGKDEALTGQLRQFLNGDRINARTDDDKSLFIAVKK